MKYLLVYLILVNAAGFLLMLADKRKAIKNKWRIPEKVLLTTAVLGGSFGVMTGMYAVRHKTLHLTFSLGVPILFALQVTAFFFLLSKYI